MFGYIPYAFLTFIILSIIFAFILHKTIIGKRIYSIGNNPESAQYTGIQVDKYTFVLEDGRVMNLDPSNTALIGSSNIKWMKNSMGDEGEFAILSATSQATNQNAWIEEMKKEFAKPEYSKMKWVDTVYGDDLFDKSYQEALGLFKKYPNLKGIIAPTSVGIVAAAKAVEDQGLVGKVYVTGLGLPSEMKAHVKNGSLLNLSYLYS